MKPEHEPVSEDELLIRLVFHDRFSDRTPIVSLSAFAPRVKGRAPDTDGISLFRLACVSTPEDVLAVIAEEKRPLQGLVLIPYSVLRDRGLTVVPKPIPEVPGHVVVPELNATNYAADSSRFTTQLLALAEAASQNICRRPTPPAGR